MKKYLLTLVWAPTLIALLLASGIAFYAGGSEMDEIGMAVIVSGLAMVLFSWACMRFLLHCTGREIVVAISLPLLSLVTSWAMRDIAIQGVLFVSILFITLMIWAVMAKKFLNRSTIIK